MARQFFLGAVQTAAGPPPCHKVYEGNTAETKTLLRMLTTLVDRLPAVRRLIRVADSGLSSPRDSTLPGLALKILKQFSKT